MGPVGSALKIIKFFLKFKNRNKIHLMRNYCQMLIQIDLDSP